MHPSLSHTTGCLRLLAGFFVRHKCPKCGRKFRRGGVVEWVKGEGSVPVCRKCHARHVAGKAP